ncbi:PREDICTED: probable cytochrome P450 6a14 [Eufriesea mexicana]|uniref:probable cytochrome P450 6a14 n=2 Tax=Eufriesea mexicana TaxID=516756 RepID=UPI00083BFE9E|nr:PREDICTED: probable cytochrome P450 6a14 [Eufriesea mexicana]
MDYFQIVCGLVVVVLGIYYYYKSIYDTWKNRGILGPKPTYFVGNFLNILIKKESVSDSVKTWYDEFKHEPVFGIFEGRTPVLVINDLDMVKDVLIRNFSTFVDRGFRIFPKIEPLMQHLFLLEPERWRPLRAKLSPIFTSGKLKEMFPLIVECAENLETYLDKVEEDRESVECRDLAAKFTTDVIGSCAFGINMNALMDEGSEFRQMGKKIFAPDLKRLLRESCRQFIPWLYRFVGPLLEQKDVNNFFINLITNSIKYRRENKVVRPDFVHLLMELQDHPDKVNNMELTDSLLAAQAFVFFAAGFETSSSTIAHALYELAQHQDIQNKLRQEIKEVTKKNIKNLTYNDIKEMKYLDKVFKETLRKYPLLPMLTRQAIEDYTFSGTKITVPKGMKVWIPVYGIQRDPNIYPKPEVFDPERFTDEAVATRHPMSYLPFGDGPRNCIGARFAHYQTKIGIMTIIRNHKVKVCEKTTIPYESDARNFLLTLKDGVNLKIEKA